MTGMENGLSFDVPCTQAKEKLTDAPMLLAQA